MKLNRKRNAYKESRCTPENVKLQFQEFQDYFNIHFKNPTLLYQAFTHSSYVNEHRRKLFTDNERLEFLGDAVLELSVSKYLYSTIHHI